MCICGVHTCVYVYCYVYTKYYRAALYVYDIMRCKETTMYMYIIIEISVKFF